MTLGEDSMKLTLKQQASLGLGVALAGALAFGATPAMAQKVKMAVPTFLTGAGAPAFGIPARNGVDLIVRGINNGELPPPYNTPGLAGRQIDLNIYDEAGGNTKQVTELRNKVQKQNVDLVVGFISSGTCAAVARVAEELKIFTVLSVCGTPRVFEELNKNPKYVFRTMNHATASNVSAAHYVARKMAGEVNGYIGLNQNYAWGQDSWRDFDLAMKVLAPKIKAARKQQFPKLFSGQYGSEISALMRSKQSLVHSSFWGGDLEAFIGQANARGLFKRKRFLFTVGETVAYRLGTKFPQGLMIGSRGPYGMYAVGDKSPLNVWFQREYRKAYNRPPAQPGYQFAQSILAAKYAYDKAAKAAGAFPTTDQVIKALEGATFQSFAGKVNMGLSKGHQGLTEDVWGITTWDESLGELVVKDVVRFKPECIMPPEGIDSVSWLKGGMKGAKCDM
jgi:branched-chain amino acid transport system substrate-binding protein